LTPAVISTVVDAKAVPAVDKSMKLPASGEARYPNGMLVEILILIFI